MLDLSGSWRGIGSCLLKRSDGEVELT